MVRDESAGREVKRMTLADLLRILHPDSYIHILHRLGPREYEVAAEGTVRELLSTRCAEVCGDNVVISIALDASECLKTLPGEDAPVLVATIGGKETEPWVPAKLAAP